LLETGPMCEFFLGGSDLEMVTIRELLLSRSLIVHHRKLAWGANAAAYRDEIDACRAAGRVAILIELIDDLHLQEAVDAGEVLLIDHHGDRAGADVPTALEQVFKLLKLPPGEWSREFALIAANDRGYIEEMLAIAPPATREEIARIRAADRQAQGISRDEEAKGLAAAEQREQFAEGQLTVVRLPHNRSATVTDSLHTALGGPGFENLLILTPSHTLFVGNGLAIERLKQLHPEGWSGGALPTRGYWGIAQELKASTIISAVKEI